MTGFHVEVEDLRTYSRSLADNKSAVSRVSGLVDDADVGDKSWGIVGIFVKQHYTEMLGDLQDLLRDMADGLQTASDKFARAADVYQQTEDDHTETWHDLTARVNGAATTTA
jgi:hypothetical protein